MRRWVRQSYYIHLFRSTCEAGVFPVRTSRGEAGYVSRCRGNCRECREDGTAERQPWRYFRAIIIPASFAHVSSRKLP